MRVTDAGQQAKRGRGRRIAGLSVYFLQHAQVLLSSLGRLYRAPLSSLMTTAVIGIALALPAGLYVLLDNVHAVNQGWDGSARISLFLLPGSYAEGADQFSRDLEDRADIQAVRFISPEQAMDEFRQLSGFSEALQALEENPLPAVMVVTPDPSLTDPDAIRALAESLRALPQVDQAQLDLQWVRRLDAIMQIARRSVLIVGSLLSLAVLLVVGNTIRLEIENRRQEIEVSKLIGATNAFVRRPFLYSGLWYGVLGGVLAWTLIWVSLWLLQGPAKKLALLYDSGFLLAGMSNGKTGLLLLLSALLGLCGSWLAVGRHLSAIKPS